jgi:GNAT superfamily N-acetyltransferase
MTTTPSADLLIRDATADELGSVLDLYEAAGLDAPGDNDRAAARDHFARIVAMGGVVLLAFRDGTPAATLTLFVLPLLAHRGRPEALVEDVAVHPQAQGGGIGRALMAEAMRRARQAGCYKLALSSNRKREAAHAFYDRLGFERHGVSFVVPLDRDGGAA